MTVPHWFYRIVQEGDTGHDVRTIRTMLSKAPEGPYDESMAALVRGHQKRAGIAPSGVVDGQTAAILGEPSTYGMIPTWWMGQTITYGTTGTAVLYLSRRLGVWPQLDYDDALDRAIRRWEAARGYEPSGNFTEQYAIELGD